MYSVAPCAVYNFCLTILKEIADDAGSLENVFDGFNSLRDGPFSMDNEFVYRKSLGCWEIDDTGS